MAKISELTLENCAKYARCSSSDDILAICFDAAKDYVLNQTGLDSEEANKYDDLATAVLVLTADMYDNRSNSEQSAQCNRIVDAIISHHRRNLV